MGGRGSSSGTAGGSSDGVITGGGTTHIESSYIEARGWNRARYSEEILEATTDGNGNVTFSYATPTTDTKTAKTNKTHYTTYDLQAGAVDGETFGINWAKVQSISGQTYNLRQEAKAAGLTWDSKQKKWIRK